MKVTVKNVECIDITGVEELDPISVYIDHVQEHAAEIVIKCYDKSWTHYWGSMGSDLKTFFIDANNSYLINKLDHECTISKVDIDQIIEDAKDLDMHICPSSYVSDEEGFEIYGENWDGEFPVLEKYEYKYIERIVDAVRNAFKTLKEQENE